MDNATRRRLYTILANAIPAIFIVWLSMQLYHRYVQHDERLYFVLGLWVLMVAMSAYRIYFLVRHGWDAATANFDDETIRMRLYVYAAIIVILLALNGVALYLAR